MISKDPGSQSTPDPSRSPELLGRRLGPETARGMDLGAAGELNPRAAAEGGRKFLLGRLDLEPVAIANRGDAPVGEERAESFRPGMAVGPAARARRLGGQPEQTGPGQLHVTRARPAGQIGQQAAHGLSGVGLVGAYHAGRTALEPASDIL